MRVHQQEHQEQEDTSNNRDLKRGIPFDSRKRNSKVLELSSWSVSHFDICIRIHIHIHSHIHIFIRIHMHIHIHIHIHIYIRNE